MNKSIFTLEQDQTIRDRYPTEGTSFCGELGFTSAQLMSRAKYLKIRSVNSRLFAACARTRNRKNVNIDYFYGDITENMAYLLGYIWADGCIRQYYCESGPNILQLCCQKKDEDILIKITKELGITKEIKYTPLFLNKKGRKQGNHVSVNISNYLFVKPLVERFGIIPRKSFCDCQFPDYIPEDKWSHFCRGFLDGDGSFDHNINHPPNKGYRVLWVGNDLFIEGLRNLLVQLLGVREVAILENKESKTGLLRNIRWASAADFLTIGDFLYPPGNEYLYGNRKRAYFEKARKLMFGKMPHMEEMASYEPDAL